MVATSLVRVYQLHVECMFLWEVSKLILSCLTLVNNHKPEDAGKQHAGFAQEESSSFFPTHPPHSSFCFFFLSVVFGRMTGAMARKKLSIYFSPIADLTVVFVRSC